MVHTVSIWLLAAAFLGAGLFNAIGTPATQSEFVRWGYPAWWCRVTGASEITAAILIAFPSMRGAGLLLGVVIIAAALVTVVRHREHPSLAPLGLFGALLLTAWLA